MDESVSHESSAGDAREPAEPAPPPDVSPPVAAPVVVSAPLSPCLRSSWLLRAAALAACGASIFGVLVAPGLPGNAPGPIVDAFAQLSDVFAYATMGLLIALIFVGAFELARPSQRLGMAPRILAVGAAGLVVALAAPAVRDKLHPLAAIFLSMAASVVGLTAGWQALRAPHTRAVGVVLLAMSLASLARLGAWELAGAAGERSSTRMYEIASGVASAGVVLEGLGQLAAAAWLGTRGRFAGRLLSNLAVAAAFVTTWGAARGVHAGAEPWQAVLHTALADAPGAPPPLGLSAIATFLACCGIFLALVAIVQRGQVVAVVAALSLALLARGTFDVPLRAIAIAAAGHWLLLAGVDDRSMWRALVAQRAETLPAAERAAL